MSYENGISMPETDMTKSYRPRNRRKKTYHNHVSVLLSPAVFRHATEFIVFWKKIYFYIYFIRVRRETFACQKDMPIFLFKILFFFLHVLHQSNLLRSARSENQHFPNNNCLGHCFLVWKCLISVSVLVWYVGIREGLLIELKSSTDAHTPHTQMQCTRMWLCIYMLCKQTSVSTT